MFVSEFKNYHFNALYDEKKSANLKRFLLILRRNDKRKT